MRSPENIYSAPATADYSAAIARFVTLATTGTFTYTGTSAQANGVMYNAPILGDPARCDWGGVQRIEAGTGGITVGAKVFSDSAGKGVVGVTTAGAYYMGTCSKAAAAGEVGEFIWSPGQYPG